MRKEFVLAIFCAVSLPCFALPADPYAEAKRCTREDECADAVEVKTGCHHYCGTVASDRCSAQDAVFVCPAYNIKFDRFPDCAVNISCKKPTKVWCEAGICMSR